MVGAGRPSRRIAASEIAGNLGNTVAFWDTSTWRLRRRLNRIKGGTQKIAYSGDGRVLASVGDLGMLRLWDGRSGELLREMQGHRGIVWALSFDPTGSIAASGGREGRLLLWNTETGKIMRSLREGKESVLSLEFSRTDDGWSAARGWSGEAPQ